MDPVREETLAPPPESVWPSRQKFQDRRWLNGLLLLLTVASTTYVGTLHWVEYAAQAHIPYENLGWASLLLRGFWYSGTILAILGCHELGHYLACRYYDVDASLPFFLPTPFLTGTLGAFIRIREPIPSKRMLFDIGIAGPIAGFVILVPALIIGLAMSTVVSSPLYEVVGFFGEYDALQLGEPLLFEIVGWVMAGTLDEGYTLNLHPVAFAAWFGMIATFLNLSPLGQLDGGHISYAVLGQRSSNVTLVAILGAVILTLFSPGLFVWTGLMVLMLWRFGRHHPRTFDEAVPLDSSRKLLALVAILIFLLCFTPAPLQPVRMLR
ncbi:MAG: site-2 protease family protein [Vicinamibacterales bacterium]